MATPSRRTARTSRATLPGSWTNASLFRIRKAGSWQVRLRRSPRWAALGVAAAGLALVLPGGAGAGKSNPPGFLTPSSSGAATVTPAPGFNDSVVFSGLTNPTAVRFAPDGKVFVAEKGGKIKMFSSLSATTPTVYADLSKNVDDYWDRGMLGLAIDPNWPAQPFVYTSYTYDSSIGGAAPRWSDGCPTPPGPTTDGCVVSGRLSRLSAGADYRALVMADSPVGYWLQVIDPGGAKFGVGVGGVNHPLSAGGVVTAGSWYHLVGTYDGSTQRLYVNRALVASQAPTGNVDTVGGDFRIGTTRATEFFNGTIDDVAVYNKALTPAQVEAHYEAGAQAITEKVLVEDWCQQYPSHSIGDLHFGPDGAPYWSAGEGSNFNIADHGQGGGGAGSPTPPNPCGDPPAGVGG